MEEIALTASSQRRKLSLVLEAIGQSLQVEQPSKWSVEGVCVACWGGRVGSLPAV